MYVCNGRCCLDGSPTDASTPEEDMNNAIIFNNFISTHTHTHTLAQFANPRSQAGVLYVTGCYASSTSTQLKMY